MVISSLTHSLVSFFPLSYFSSEIHFSISLLRACLRFYSIFFIPNFHALNFFILKSCTHTHRMNVEYKADKNGSYHRMANRFVHFRATKSNHEHQFDLKMTVSMILQFRIFLHYFFCYFLFMPFDLALRRDLRRKKELFPLSFRIKW